MTYSGGVMFLTRQQKLVLGMVLFLLVTGWAVKTWRLARPGSAIPDARMEQTR